MGGTLRIALSWGQTETLDPQAVAGTSADIARNFAIFQRLFVPDAVGAYQGVLADSMEGNADASQFDLTVREGATWQDGSPFTAADVVYSLQRILTKDLGLEGYENLQMIDAAGIKAMDAKTVRIPLLYSYADFQAQLSDRMILMVKDGTTDFTTLNGTGPFTYVSTDQGRRIVLERNPNYWQSPYPYLDGVEILNLVDSTAGAERAQDRRDRRRRGARPGRPASWSRPTTTSRSCCPTPAAGSRSS